MRSGTRVLIGGIWETGFGGNLTSSVVLHQAFETAGMEVYRFGFARDWTPGGPLATEGERSITLHTRALASHSEGILHRRILRKWLLRIRPEVTWVFNSRHVSALPASVPYILWEATTWKDERKAVTLGLKASGRRGGAGRLLHGALRPIDRYAERYAFRRASIVAAMSRHTARQVIAEGLASAEQVCVLTHPPSKSLESRTAIEGIADKPARWFVSVARWPDPRKGASLLQQAARQLAGQGSKYSWTLVGDGAEELTRALSAEGIDARPASAPDAHTLVSLLRQHRYLVIPSFQEGFGITGIEAFHCGVPVVTTRCGGPEEYVKDGQTGFVGDVNGEGLAQALLRAGRLDEEARSLLARRAQVEAREQFSNKHFLKEVMRLSSQVFRGSVAEGQL